MAGTNVKVRSIFFAVFRLCVLIHPVKIPDYGSGEDWQKVKRYMWKHDEDKMKGYSDDIDALLTLVRTTQGRLRGLRRDNFYFY